MRIFKQWWTWIRKLWETNSQCVTPVLEKVTQLAPLVDAALPIVEDINQHLKTHVKGASGVLEIAEAVTSFLREYSVAEDEINAIAEKSADLPVAEILAYSAMAILRVVAPNTLAANVARTVIELAYSIYKDRQENNA